ncbi:hypothetical protein RDV64_04595 [Acuticoccus sp. MNP-M23]|uniref:hypothetical protein n=1 Tax=Acuticoccus sp. MNP-M23 TaxID=3072793 RepID=UPI002815F78C|nr:hypothetical protein [Acuticoccus sp. MNP-M23]WMS43684.1 hypothetical protein RDV64_04595 [Acuticoccus sp. MNP-M23]
MPTRPPHPGGNLHPRGRTVTRKGPASAAQPGGIGRFMRLFRGTPERRQPPAPQKVPIYVVGMSHTRALAAAMDRVGADDIAIGRVSRASSGDDHPLDPASLGKLAPTVAISMMGGNQHNRLGLFEAPEPFDFYLHADDTVLPGRRIIPHAQMRHAMSEMMQRAFERTTELAAYYKVPTAHVAAPPPVDDEEHLVTSLADKAEEMGLSLVFTPPSVRLKIYQLQNRILSAWCEAHEIDFIPAPPEAQNAGGFLAKRYRRNDPTHGNAQYGALVLDQIRAYGRSHGAAVAQAGTTNEGAPQ